MIAMQVEDWATLWNDGQELMRENHKETGDEGLEFDPDAEGYQALYDQGRLVVLTVRDDQTLVGYLAFVILNHFHSRKVKCAFEELFYLSPKYRKGRLGIDVMNFAERVLPVLKVGRVYYTSRPQRELTKLFQRRSMSLIASMWAKDLEPANG